LFLTSHGNQSEKNAPLNEIKFRNVAHPSKSIISSVVFTKKMKKSTLNLSMYTFILNQNSNITELMVLNQQNQRKDTLKDPKLYSNS